MLGEAMVVYEQPNPISPNRGQRIKYTGTVKTENGFLHLVNQNSSIPAGRVVKVNWEDELTP